MSVFPEKIGIEELEYLMKGTDRLTLLKRLERLSEAFLIQEVLVGWNVYYKFSHRLFQEYVYEKRVTERPSSTTGCWRNIREQPTGASGPWPWQPTTMISAMTRSRRTATRSTI